MHQLLNLKLMMNKEDIIVKKVKIMIYITGDTHSDFTRFTEDKFPIQDGMTKNDYVIICGDFGGVWTFEEESSREKEELILELEIFHGGI